MAYEQKRSHTSLLRKESSRREFLATAAACTAVASLPANSTEARLSPGTYQGKLCFFSKALPSMGWQPLGKTLKRLGFDGVDLTVRPEGHVLPERAAEDLPKAVEAIRNEGLEVRMITTALVSAEDPAARPILSTAGRLGITYYKAGYYLYKLIDVRRELEDAGKDFRGLVDLGKQYGMQAGYHNHEGYIGAPVWDMASVIEPLDPKWAGFYFDPRHAVAEGGVGGWKIATNLVLPRLKMIAVKDFYWAKTARKGWQDINCPLGEGMVNWKYFFQSVARGGFQAPISLHIEYEIPGATSAAKEDNTLRAAQRDLDFLKARVQEAYTGA
jgi:sugar phosphate isomerase/epimerase